MHLTYLRRSKNGFVCVLLHVLSVSLKLQASTAIMVIIQLVEIYDKSPYMVWKRVKISLCLSNEKATFQGPFTVIFGSISRITVQWERSFCSTPSCLGFNCKQILQTMNRAVSQQIRAALKPACISQKPFIHWQHTFSYSIMTTVA